MKKIFFILIVSINLHSASSHAAKLEDLLEKKELPKKIGELIANQDISFGLNLASVELIDGINLSTKYNYDVEASYINKHFTRVDKWDLNSGIDVGEIIKDSIDIPFSFSVKKNSSFYFVRQFQEKNDALKALPYTPKKLPLNAKLALENLNTGDFVSMPANLSVAVGLQAATNMISPLVVDAKAGIYYVLNGEFIIQVFKLDRTHVRLKLITKRGKQISSRAGVGVSFNVFGISLLDHQVDRLFERDLAEYGYTYSPGAQFIIDYIFDLSDKDASVAYNQILSSTFKFKDILVTRTADASELKDKLISSYEKADALFEADKNNDPKDRRVQRIFKGFNNYKGHTRHLNFSFFVTAYSKDRTFTESKVTFVDKNEKNLDFFYPTYSKYIENHLGKWFFELKDQSYQNNFGLLPTFNLEDSKTKNPDLGLTFERKDKFFSPSEQRSVERFMISEIDVGEIIKDSIDIPFSFSVKKNSSFY